MSWNKGTSWGLTPDLAEDWRKRAACRSVDPELFFPIGKTDGAVLQSEAAKAVCRNCPVLADCEKWVREFPQEFGVFAAMSPQERIGWTRQGSMPGGTTGRCRNGHRMTLENTRFYGGVRQCLKCYIARRDRHLAKRSVAKSKVEASDAV